MVDPRRHQRVLRLGFNILVNVLTLTGLMIGVIAVPAGDVLGTVLPALGVALILGNLYYTFLARRLARRENRTDVTALPYGPSVPHMFIVVFVVMLPVYLDTKDPLQAWEAGLAWAFMIGVIVMIGAFVGPLHPQAHAPRRDARHPGRHLDHVHLDAARRADVGGGVDRPAGDGDHPHRFFTNVKLPFGIPVGLAALLVGTAIGWIGGYMSAPDVGQAVSDIALGIPDLRIDMLFSGLSDLAPLLGTAIPLGVYNFTEAMSNVESAAAAGDNYNLRSVLLADGAGAVDRFRLRLAVPARGLHRTPRLEGRGRQGGILAREWCGDRIVLLPGAFRRPRRFTAGTGDRADPALHRLLIGAQAFQAVPRLHAVAVVAAILPNLAQWASGLIDNALNAAGTSADKVGLEALNGAGVVYEGLQTLGEGAVLVGLILGTMVTYILEKKFLYAAIASVVGAVLSFIGLIHAPEVAWAANPPVALGYLFFGIVCVAYSFLPGAKDPVEVDEADVVAGH